MDDIYQLLREHLETYKDRDEFQYRGLWFKSTGSIDGDVELAKVMDKKMPKPRIIDKPELIPQGINAYFKPIKAQQVK